MKESETVYFLPRLDTTVHIIVQVDNQEAKILIKNEKQHFGTRYIRKLTGNERTMDQQTLAEELVEETYNTFETIGKDFSKSMDKELRKIGLKRG